MARADSTIRVNIIGDAKSLTKAANTAEGSVKGMNSTLLKAGGIIAGAFVTDAVIDFGATALREADRVGDAVTRLEGQLGELAPALIDTSEGFHELGLSKQDVLELEAALVDMGTALGIADDELVPLSIDATTAAGALALLTDTDADTWIATIGKAASGSEKALRALGVSVTEAEVEARALAMTGKDTADSLTEGELAAARLELILEELAPRIKEVTEGTGDLEQKTSELQAKFETLQGKIGQAVEGPLNDLLDFVLTGIEGFELLEQKTGAFSLAIEAAALPVKLLNKALKELGGVIQAVIDLYNEFLRVTGQTPTGFRPGTGGGSGNSGGSRSSGQTSTTTINVNGGSPEVIEQSVRRALQQATGRGPLE